ncbi:MAG: DUF3093 domain-containing protein [Georgenia sp.]
MNTSGTPLAPSTPIFTERLTPPAGWHVVSLLLGVGAFLALTPLVAQVVAVAVGAVVAASVSAALVLSSPTVSIATEAGTADGGTPAGLRLRAGGAVIPVEVLGTAEVLDAAGVRAWLGPDADARAHVCHRAWMPAAVRITVPDPRDATPYWLVCSRRPAQLVAALGRPVA